MRELLKNRKENLQNSKIAEKGIFSVIPFFRYSVIPFFRHSVIPFFRHSVIPLFRHSKNNSRSGAVMMEYVIVAVLIAAACMLAVVVVGRAVTRGWIISATSTAGQGTKAGEMGGKAGNMVGKDAAVAEEYSDSFHDLGGAR